MIESSAALLPPVLVQSKGRSHLDIAFCSQSLRYVRRLALLAEKSMRLSPMRSSRVSVAFAPAFLSNDCNLLDGVRGRLNASRLMTA